ncbi:MAG TPA: sensor histidine kinase [Nocardioides sp.]|nr:sensor histidine kinase [Nocardioides sp.]
MKSDHSSRGRRGGPPPARFEHEAAFYAGPGDHLRMCLAFVEEGLDRGEPVMVALVPERSEALSTALGAAADAIQFVDMTELGRNPARIIPQWQQFITERGGSGPVRGIGEPAWPGRTFVEYAEAALHEGLLNLAFDNGQPWRLMCPYDLTGLPPEVLDEARRTHPVIHNEPDGSERFGGYEHTVRGFSTLLPVPARGQRVDFDRDELPLIRGFAVRIAQASGLSPAATENLALAVHELATNSVVHGRGPAALWYWEEPDAVVVEVHDAGFIGDPLVGRRAPDPMQEDGRGVWMANQLCDLVQIRSSEAGTQVRVRMRTRSRPDQALTSLMTGRA